MILPRTCDNYLYQSVLLHVLYSLVTCLLCHVNQHLSVPAGSARYDHVTSTWRPLVSGDAASENAYMRYLFECLASRKQPFDFIRLAHKQTRSLTFLWTMEKMKFYCSKSGIILHDAACSQTQATVVSFVSVASGVAKNLTSIIVVVVIK